MRRGRRRLALATAAVVGIVSVLCAAMCRQSAEIKDRRTLRAWLLIPKDLRQFPVETYAVASETIAYRMLTAPRGLTRWRLQINTHPERRSRWNEVFTDYTVACGFGRLMIYGRPQGRLYRQYWAAQGKGRFLMIEDSTTPNTLNIAFEFHDSIPDKGLRKYLRLASVCMRRLRARFRGNAYDAIADVS
jgi:hypothetical protein